ncbi:WD40/YVTN/BNR-like repeat-containing protein [Lentiprolixibacter aurantiacus]|uniref:YCF48-related protein n=1 Tax=Lentiprolixibacter aurantiacus TaxID=2993939 RepID=A0AAE3MMM8_9FLAO|nr:YCF48-related protein [Lentiprolixibacter aurantiacus]MCX2720243.1 YCF48-related protein [Lentiprolixibacter aurantiacus]
MRITVILLVFMFLSCADRSATTREFSEVEVDLLYQDSISIRAIEIMGGSLAFAANKGVFGSVDLRTGKVRTAVQAYDSILPEFRAIAHTSTDFFMLSAGNPALLYKTGDKGSMELVYTESGEGVFYDAMAFWDDQEGIALGDSREGCLSVLVTRDGGQHWEKIPCRELPESPEGEGAFAASNTNISIIGDEAWIATTEARVFHTSDRGRTWKVMQTPMGREAEAQGIFSIAFYDSEQGFAIGGDYTKPEVNIGNKAVTKNGGKTWDVVSDGEDPGYKSCVQYVPDSGGKGLVAVGYTGISYSPDSGENWKELSTESFYTLRFHNDSTAFAAGSNRIARLSFK